jgi:hypothetical protein
MIKQFKFIFLASSIFVVLFSSCVKESVIVTQQDYQKSNNELKSLVSQVKNWHDDVILSKNSSYSENNIKSLSTNPDDIIPPKINWNLAFKNFDSANIRSLTIPLDFNISTGEFFQLVATSNNDSLNGYLIKQIPDSAYYAKHPNILDMTGFTGTYIVYDLFGNCLSKKYLKSGVVTSNNSNISQIGNLKSNSTSAPCSGCTLLTVIVYNSPTYLRNDYTKSLGGAAIIQYNNLSYVIAGGGGSTNDMLTYLSFVAIPNGQCVFGSLAYLGTILGGNSDINYYIGIWAKSFSMSATVMAKNLINDPNSRPNGQGALSLLTNNFVTQRLSNTDEVINSAKQGNSIFVLIDWGNNTGHCVIIGWNDDKQSLYCYDSVSSQPITFIDTNSYIFSKMKIFFAVTDSKI